MYLVPHAADFSQRCALGDLQISQRMLSESAAGGPSVNPVGGLELGRSVESEPRDIMDRDMHNGTSPYGEQQSFTPEAVAQAYSRIKSVVHKTPILTSTSFNSLVTLRMSVYFKAELFQKCGVFKFRGASNAISRLPEEALQKGVVTHSSGNHSAALACAARERGIKCYVVMVISSPKPANTSLQMQVNLKLKQRERTELKLHLSSNHLRERKCATK